MPFGNESRESGIGLALSGGGFRATLFHVGAIWRLNEFGYLPKLDRISSVSGGSITAGLLGARWNQLKFQNGIAINLSDQFVIPLRSFCERNVDVPSVLLGVLHPGKSISQMVQEEYEDHLFGVDTLQALPDRPRFVFNATNFTTGVSFRFSKPYMGDYRIGLVKNPKVRISFAVAASSAFPPMLSPAILEGVDPGSFEKVEGADLYDDIVYRKRLVLADGGVYDNLGLETVWNRYETVLVSDAGAPFGSDSTFTPHLDKQLLRVMDIMTNQSRALRKRALIADYGEKKAKGTYWGVMTKIKDYGLDDSLPVSESKTKELADIRTRLDKFTESEQCQLINCGYAICDAAMRCYVLSSQASLPAPKWPYPQYELGKEVGLS